MPGRRIRPGAAVPGEDSTPGARAPRPGRPEPPGRAGVGLLLGGLAIVTLFTVKATFLVYLAAAVGVALWELSRALGTRDIRLPLVPVAVGGVAAAVLRLLVGRAGRWWPCVALTVIAILAWRLTGGTAGYLRDVTAGVFALGYLPLMAGFVALMLATPDGSRRILVFVILAVCSDIGGYFAGILARAPPMVPVISPKKTWEGFARLGAVLRGGRGHAAARCCCTGVWQGVLLGAAALLAATLGDLAESMIKRDLEIKDMGTVLPGHGGVLDRLDSLLIAAPVVWLLLLVFISRTEVRTDSAVHWRLAASALGTSAGRSASIHARGRCGALSGMFRRIGHRWLRSISSSGSCVAWEQQLHHGRPAQGRTVRACWRSSSGGCRCSGSACTSTEAGRAALRGCRSAR